MVDREQAHNDMHFIHSDQKIMQLKVKDYNICLVDSLNFSNGDFPFKFNTHENQNYVGPMPDIKYYSQDTKSEKDHVKLIAWHE